MLVAILPVAGKPKTRRVPSPNLSLREIEILLLVGDGLQGKEIAQRLGLSPKTIEFYKTRMYGRIGVTGAIGAVRYAIRHGYMDA
ncbi:MAG: DNA-binding response regulator, LuxR family [Bryobacterales bacterium]|nr:DNA-binding response regulator, LuxR family [Bryobacterales bacterium]